MSNERGNCIDCGEERCHLDDDPNGERIDNKPQRPAPPQNLRSVLEKLPQLPQRQDSTAAQLADLRVIANRLGLYDAADAIKTMLGRP